MSPEPVDQAWLHFVILSEGHCDRQFAPGEIQACGTGCFCLQHAQGLLGLLGLENQEKFKQQLVAMSLYYKYLLHGHILAGQ